MSSNNTSQADFDILGFDVTSAMALLGDNEDLYITVLQRFYDNYRNVPDQLTTLSIITDKEELQRTAHTIKGLAATIGAVDLHIKAKATEYAIREGREPMLLTLKEALSDCLDKIACYFAKKNGGAITEKQPPKFEKYSVEALVEHLSKRRYLSDDELDKYKAALKTYLDDTELARTLDAIKDLNYDIAMQIIENKTD